MKLYIKQKLCSVKDRFNIFDENGESRYYAVGEIFSIVKKLHLYSTANETEVAFVYRKKFTFLSKFIVCRDGKEVARIIKKLHFFSPRYVVEGLGWTIEGKMNHHHYTVSEGDRVIAKISKKWVSFGDSYEIDISDGADEVMALAIVLAIDAELFERQMPEEKIYYDDNWRGKY